MKQESYIVTIVLVVALLVAVGYIGVDKYTTSKQQEQFNLLQQGALAGYQQAVLEIVQQAATCQAVPLFVGNQTINLIAVECLQQASQ